MNKRGLMVAAAGVAAGVAARELYRKLREENIAGRVVLITGGSRGLGLALARRFAGEGCRIAICARDGEELERAREDLRSRNTEAFAVRCDVTDSGQVDSMISDSPVALWRHRYPGEQRGNHSGGPGGVDGDRRTSAAPWT